jgi:hypothetical protein
VTAGNFTFEYAVTNVPDRGWTGGILFDDAVRDALRGRSFSTRRSVSDISDKFWNVTQYYPVLIDGLLVPLAFDRLNVDVAWQMTMLNWQAQSLSFLLTRLAHRTVGRQRPEVLECDKDPAYTGACSPDAAGRTASFFSGHASMSFAGAGLTCAHHRALPLYGGNVADAAICGLSITSAATVGIMRLVADAHWTTDVLFGAAVGGAVGYGLPTLLHYGSSTEDNASLGGVLPRNVALAPLATPTVTGIAVMGLF